MKRVLNLNRLGKIVECNPTELRENEIMVVKNTDGTVDNLYKRVNNDLIPLVKKEQDVTLSGISGFNLFVGSSNSAANFYSCILRNITKNTTTLGTVIDCDKGDVLEYTITLSDPSIPVKKGTWTMEVEGYYIRMYIFNDNNIFDTKMNLG